ncbi:MAG TPA: glycosyl transferase family 1 [Prevotella sp.]|nr:glycosyl transferase family 1 [Prevotella sp.]
MKVLIVTPSPKLTGGVTFYYKGLDAYWSNDVTYVTYGRRPNMPALICVVPDLMVYICKLLFGRPDVVIVNPSFRPYQLKRDGLYLLLARLMGKKVVSLFHGWDRTYSRRMELRPSRYVGWFNKSAFIYVLCSDFKKALLRMGIHAPILLATTEVRDSLVEDYDNTQRTGEIRNLLFLARIDKRKGIYETIETFALLKRKYPCLTLNICGDSDDRQFVQDVKDFVATKNIKDIVFHGAVYGQEKIQAFKDNDLYILPTYEEGMATSQLEAMAFGLPVISRPEGGIKDHFENEAMGYLIDSLDPHVYADKIGFLIDHPDVCKRMGNNAFQYAHAHFLASSVARKFETDINIYCHEK